MTGFDALDDYEHNCRVFDHPDRVPAWVALREVLEGRDGWRFELENGTEPLWLFGLGGAGRLVAYAVGPEHVHLYDADADNGAGCGDEVDQMMLPAELRAWLVTNEAKHQGYTALQVELGSYLGSKELEEVVTTADLERPAARTHGTGRHCRGCDAEILTQQLYVSVVWSVEAETPAGTVQPSEATELLALCSDCGNRLRHDIGAALSELVDGR